MDEFTKMVQASAGQDPGMCSCVPLLGIRSGHHIIIPEIILRLVSLQDTNSFCTPDMGDNLAVKVCSAESNKRNRSGSQRQGKYREVLTEGSRI